MAKQESKVDTSFKEDNPSSVNFQEKRELSVEKALQRLEAYIHRLEEGDIDLDQAFKIFENASRLSRKLRKKLESYERKVEVIMGDEGKDEFNAEPWEERKKE